MLRNAARASQDLRAVLRQTCGALRNIAQVAVDEHAGEASSSLQQQVNMSQRTVIAARESAALIQAGC